LSFLYIFYDLLAHLHHSLFDPPDVPSWRLKPRRRILAHVFLILFLVFGLVMLDAANLRGLWHSDQKDEFVFENTMRKRDGNGGLRCGDGCSRKERRQYVGLLNGVSVLGVVLL
jgi:hypothetical protein